MGNGPLQIGQGVGEASVWNPMVPVQNFNTLIQQKKLKEQADADALAAELSKVRSDGLRNDADRSAFFNKYEEIKNKAIGSRGERDPMKKAMNKAQIKDELLRLQDYVNRSKQQGELEKGLMTKVNDPMQRHNYVDNSVQELIGNSKLGIDDPKYKKDLSILQRQVDHAKIDEAVKKMHRDSLGDATWSNDKQDGGVTKLGDKTGVNVYQDRALTPDQILSNDMHLYTVNNDFKASLEQRYPDIQGKNPEETKALRVRQSAIDRGDVSVGANGELISNLKERKSKGFEANYKPDDWKEKALWRLAHKGDGTNYQPGTPQNMTIPYNGGGKGEVVNSLGYVPINSAALNLAGSPSYNLTSGTPEPQALSSGDHQLVGVGNFPVIKADYHSGTKKLKGTIAQPGFVKAHPNDIEYKPFLHVQTKDVAGGTEDHLVPSDRLPKNLPKATQAALNGFKAMTNQENKANTAQPTASGNITVQLPDGTTGQIPKGKLKDFQSKYPKAKILN